MAIGLIELFAQTLQVEESRLDDSTSPDNTPEWDSMKAMELVSMIEDAYDVELTTAEIMKMRTIGIVREVLTSKGVMDI